MISVVEPATEEVMAQVPRGGVEEVDAAVGAAKRALSSWRPLPPRERSTLLQRLAGELLRSVSELAQLEARNAGKPIRDARGEIEIVVDVFSYYAAAPQRLFGQTIPVEGGVDMTFREPLGVVGVIVPWNFPLLIASWKVAPALAAGNTVVLKPAELTPLTALRLEQIGLEAGLPEGVLNVVAGPGSVCGKRLVEHPDVAKVAFTGSTEVGRQIAQGAAATIKRLTLELGGKSANVVFADADLERCAAADSRRALGTRALSREAGGRGLVAARRRPAGRGQRDGTAHIRRPARGRRLVRPRRCPRRDPRHRPERTRLLVSADGPRPGFQQRPSRSRGDLRSRGMRDPVR